MDEKTSLLICLGASTAANCIPCFEHYHKKASAAGLTSEEILEAVDLASKVKSGAHLVMRNSIKKFYRPGDPSGFLRPRPIQELLLRLNIERSRNGLIRNPRSILPPSEKIHPGFGKE